jgi:hypothetical protein
MEKITIIVVKMDILLTIVVRQKSPVWAPKIVKKMVKNHHPPPVLLLLLQAWPVLPVTVQMTNVPLVLHHVKRMTPVKEMGTSVLASI